MEKRRKEKKISKAKEILKVKERKKEIKNG